MSAARCATCGDEWPCGCTDPQKSHGPIQIHVSVAPDRDIEPCLNGNHRWAYLTAGGQACGYCGVLR